ncbi:MAG: ankyrin repeat domain-containing protein [Rickettsiaceae bacterium]|nr:ankyrin repeat domain-containing protein [Rickettsiaceae bacterium]
MGKLPAQRFEELLNSHEEPINPALVINPLLEGAEGEESESESESEDDSQERALIKIAERGGAERLAAFLERGADINGLYEGETLLCIAIHNDNEQVVNFLLNDERVDIKLNINSSEHKTGYTALHVAAQYTDLDIMKLLIEKGADVSAQDSEGETPLHWIYTGPDNNMCSSERAEAVKLLIEAGPDFRIKNIKNQTALECAIKYQSQREEILGKIRDEKSMDVIASITLLETQYEKSEERFSELTLKEIAREGNVNTLVSFLERGADINELYYGQSLLCIAIDNTNTQMVRFLLENGININLNNNSSSDKEEFTALHVAAQYTDLDIMKLLIEKGADVSAQDSEGETPLHWIYTGTDNNMSSSKRAEAAKLLIEARADFRIKNIEGKTALDCATEDQRQWEEDKIIEGKEADDACDEESIDMVLSSEFLKAQYEGSSSDNLLKRTRAESGDEAIGQGHGRPRLCAIEECDVSFLEDKSDVLEMGSSVVEMDYSPS